MLPWWLVHADPAAGDPLVHAHVFFAQVLPVIRYPALHELQILPWWLMHADPVAGDPLLHVQTFVEQTRLRVVVGDVDSYCALEHTRQSRHAPLLKYLLPVHAAHLAVLCVGQELPVAPVPPEHVQTFCSHVDTPSLTSVIIR